AAAMLIAPAARLASAIADRIRAGFRSETSLAPFAGPGRDTGLVSLHQVSADISPSPCSLLDSASTGTTSGPTIRDCPCRHRSRPGRRAGDTHGAFRPVTPSRMPGDLRR